MVDFALREHARCHGCRFDAALTREQVRPLEGVSWADWERVLAARRADVPPPLETLRHLGRSVSRAGTGHVGRSAHTRRRSINIP